MWRSVYEWARACVGVAEDVRETQAEMKEVRAELRDITLNLQQCMMEVARLGEREEREREVLVLKLENRLLKEAGGFEQERGAGRGAGAALLGEPEATASRSAPACGPA